MKRILAAAAALAAILANGAVVGSCYEVGASAAVVMEAVTGELLFSQNPHEPLRIASTTKIMTALITLEQPDIDLEFTVDPDAIRVEGSSMGLEEGDTVTLRALAGGMLMASGNDAANAAAVRIAGSTEAFAGLMNRRAAEIGMRDSFFVTPSGLDAEEHRSTAYDMALLGREALGNPAFSEMCAAKSLILSYGAPPYERRLINHNRLLSLCEGCVGIKTGFTKKSGRCLVSASTRDGVTLICVTLNCPDDWNTHRELYDRCFGMVALKELVPQVEPRIPVAGGVESSVSLRQTESMSWPVISGREPEITCRIVSDGFLYAPVFDGDIAGKMVYYIGNTPVWETPLEVCGSVPARTAEERDSLWQRIRKALLPRIRGEGQDR